MRIRGKRREEKEEREGGIPRSLSSSGLFLYGHDLHDLVFQSGKEHIDDLVLFDRKGVQVDLFHALDLASLDKAP